MAQIVALPCSLCGSGAKIHHEVFGPERVVYCMCREHRCGVRGPEIRFITGEVFPDDADFLATAGWNRLHYKG